MRSLRYQVDLRDAARRLIHVRLEFEMGPLHPDDGVVLDDQIALFLPIWTPGSYLVREFARLVRDVCSLDADGQTTRLVKSAKNRWVVPIAADRRVRVAWSVYARELSVRTAYATAEGAFWNGANVYLWPIGQEGTPARIEVLTPSAWSFAAGSGVVESRTAGEFSYRVADHASAVDTPCLAGPLTRWQCEVGGRTHHFVEWGLEGIRTPAGFRSDVAAVIRTAQAVFGGDPPFAEYTFLALFGERGRGGLEHEDSSVLLAPRTTFAPRSAYEDFLGLIAHEYLHVWNVKRMRPRELWSYDFERENHTRLLWVAEGFTAYFDDLICLRAKTTTAKRYLGRLASHIESMLANPGRFRLSLADSSFDAWLLLYRPDESTRNVSQNYYTNGALAAFVIDAAIRRASGGTRTLDDAVRNLWNATWMAGRGYDHDDVVAAIDAAAGTSLGALVGSLIHGPFDPDLDAVFGLFGLRVERLGVDTPALGIRFDAGHTTIASVVDDGAGDLGGLCPADELLALERFRVSADDFERIWESVARVGMPLRVLVARGGVLREVTVVPQRSSAGKVRITSVLEPDPAQLAHRASWLGIENLDAE